MINIRIATDKDIPGLIVTHKTTWLATYPCADFDIEVADLLEKDYDSDSRIEFWKELLHHDGIKIWLGEEDGHILGFCEVRIADPNNILEAIYILPNNQGQGVGTALFQKALSWLGKDKPIELQVATYNTRAISFYNRLGFVKTNEPVKPHLLPNGKSIPCYKMILDLSA